MFGSIFIILSFSAQLDPEGKSSCPPLLDSIAKKLSSLRQTPEASEVDSALRKLSFYDPKNPRLVSLKPSNMPEYETEIEEALLAIPATKDQWQVDSLEEGYQILDQTFHIRKELSSIQEPDGRINLSKLLTERARKNPTQEIRIPQDQVTSILFAIVQDPQSPADHPRYQMYLSAGVFKEEFNARVAPRNHATLAQAAPVLYAGELYFDSDGKIVHANLHSGHYMSYRAALLAAEIAAQQPTEGRRVDSLTLTRASAALDAQRLERILHEDFGIPRSETSVLPQRVYPTFSSWNEAIRASTNLVPAILSVTP